MEKEFKSKGAPPRVTALVVAAEARPISLTEGGRARLAIPIREEPNSHRSAEEQKVDGITRRSAMKFMGATMALASGLAACVRKPPRKVISRTSQPEYNHPGQALYYSSTWTDGPFPYGMLVKVQDGRPIKLDGNPDHPINKGTSSAAMQGSLLSLYDPERLRAPKGAASWAAADQQVRGALKTAKKAVLVTRATIGPSERRAISDLRSVYPALRHVVYEPLADETRRSVWRELHGQDGEWLPRFEWASVVLAIECDFLGTDGVELESIQSFSGTRVAENADDTISRLYVVEGGLSLTGTNADHRIRLRPSLAASFVRALRDAVDERTPIDAFAAANDLDAKLLGALVGDLKENRGKAVVVAGAGLPKAAHAATALLNRSLDAFNKTLEWNPQPAGLIANSKAEIEALVEDGVDVLITLGVDVVHSWSAFAKHLSAAKLSVGHGLYLDSTLSACELRLPSHHVLESWNDARPRVGIISLCQPVIMPLYDTRQEAESLLAWASEAPDAAPHTRFRDFLKARLEAEELEVGPGMEVAWETALHQGVILGPTNAFVPAELDVPRAEALAATPLQAGAYELVLTPHSSVWDGRFGLNAWLLEVPDPVTKLMWDNAACMSASTAKRLSVETGYLVKLSTPDGSVELPALVQPGLADGVIMTALGMGRAYASAPDEVFGTNTWPLIPSEGRVQFDISVSPTGEETSLVRSQSEFSMHSRPIVLEATLGEFRANLEAIQEKRSKEHGEPIYEPFKYGGGHKWEMAIDLARCVGCNACVIACQAENNIAIVGKEECGNGREMHWMRIDQYRDPVSHDEDELSFHHQPMLCQQCDYAPCENVCPVNATNHDDEGLNSMVYNRCIGTRYCANNCPYKVRRFNFFNFQKRFVEDPVQKLLFNPQVTVRQIGVMEKCTFCVQRIKGAEFEAARTGSEMSDGVVRTACQQACPASAISFGDVNLRAPAGPAEVAVKQQSARSFLVLEELRVRPNVTYLARLRNEAGEEAPAPKKQAEERGDE